MKDMQWNTAEVNASKRSFILSLAFSVSLCVLQTKYCTLIEFLVAENETLELITYTSIKYGTSAVDRTTVSCWKGRIETSETKQSHLISHALVILSQPLL